MNLHLFMQLFWIAAGTGTTVLSMLLFGQLWNLSLHRNGLGKWIPLAGFGVFLNLLGLVINIYSIFHQP